ncbi:MAG: PilZ domain-containing protein [Desulfobacterales bacterium]|nr:PilZ domain-containing protein [Desulfobacterales bacterium]MCF8077834.1 PilZ domain-containing protein [Desulfobacterales bacterium]
MTTKEKRQHYRINSQNLLNYACYDDENNLVKQGMGRTLNVSEVGIRLETHVELEAGSRVEVTIGLEEELVTVEGKIVYIKPGQEGKFEAGIQFFELDQNTGNVLQQYIKAFRERDNQ